MSKRHCGLMAATAIGAAVALAGCGSDSTQGDDETPPGGVPEIVQHVSTDCDLSEFDQLGMPLDPRCGAYSFTITVYPTGVMVTEVEGAVALEGWLAGTGADDELDFSSPQEAIDDINAHLDEYWAPHLEELGDSWREFTTAPVGDYETGVLGDYLDEISVIETHTLYDGVVHFGAVSDVDVVFTGSELVHEDGSFMFEKHIDLQSVGNSQVFYTVHMPGEIVESDGSVSGNTATWTDVLGQDSIRVRSHGFEQAFLDAAGQ